MLAGDAGGTVLRYATSVANPVEVGLIAITDVQEARAAHDSATAGVIAAKRDDPGDDARDAERVLEAEERAGVDREHGATERVIPRQAIAKRVRQAEHPLADGDMRQDVIDELRRPGGHAPTAAARSV